MQELTSRIIPIGLKCHFGKSISDMKINKFGLETAHCVLARDYKGFGNESNGVLIYPAKVVKPYGSTGGIGGVKLKENEKDIASPITARDYKGILRNDGDAIVEVRTDGSSPKHNNRVIVGEECNDGNAKERNTFKILCLLRKEIGEKAFAEWGIAIVAPFQQAEVLRQGVHEKSFSENREEQSDIQQRPYNSEIDKQVDYKRNCLPKMWDNAEFRCSPCGRGLYQQFREQFDCALQKLSYENPSPQEFMYSLWQASKGIRLLREALSEVQEIRGRIDEQWKKSVRIRRLTPREVWRLQGFPDEYFDKAKAAGISDSQLYKMAGNAVTVNVARAIGERLKEIEE